jgi:multidrug resistance efflux pump
LKVAEVVNALSGLKEAEKAVADLADGPDPLVLAVKQQNVAVAKATLDALSEDLEELTDNIDPLEIRRREAELALAESRLEEAETRLDSVQEQVPLEIALRRAEVGLAEELAESASDDLEGAVVKAPLDGVIALVNVEVDDTVTEDSRVIEVVDPTAVQVVSMVDADEVEQVVVGAKASVLVDNLDGLELAGEVGAVSSIPRTERGVVRYQVTIDATVPEGVQIPIELSAVSVMVSR